MRGKSTEKQIETAILDYLALLPKCFVFKVNTTGVFDSQKGTFRLAKSKHIKKGVSDILGSYKGRAIAIEVKTEAEYKYLIRHYDEIASGTYTKNIKKKDHLRDQIQFIKEIQRAGGIGFFTSSINDCDYKLKEAFLELH